MSERESPVASRQSPGYSGGAALVANLALFAASLRAGGMRIGVGELVAAHRALAAVDPADREQSYFALRSTMCSAKADLEVFDVAFGAWFAQEPRAREAAQAPPALDEVAKLALPRAAVPGDVATKRLELDAVEVPAAWSEVELLRDKDFAEYTDEELARARLLVGRLASRGPMRLSRRMRAARRRGLRPHGARPDLRRTIRASLRYGGEPLERHWREPTLRHRPLLLVCDVSGSMEPYARMLLQYMHACVAARRRVEAFVFGTRLTRVTAELRGRDPDGALQRAARATNDWSGGTRIGAALEQLNREHGRRLGRGSVVVLLSDGWDRGDPEALAREMARLARCAQRVVWLNPLKAHPDYEPLTRGMRAALPHVDDFLAGNSIASLEQLADLLDGGSG